MDEKINKYINKRVVITDDWGKEHRGWLVFIDGYYTLLPFDYDEPKRAFKKEDINKLYCLDELKAVEL